MDRTLILVRRTRRFEQGSRAEPGRDSEARGSRDRELGRRHHLVPAPTEETLDQRPGGFAIGAGIGVRAHCRMREREGSGGEGRGAAGAGRDRRSGGGIRLRGSGEERGSLGISLGFFFLNLFWPELVCGVGVACQSPGRTAS
ncbi:uncharacterized protein A4U43_C08F10750 [Asparagus officinalis]|nr:uncharacterized protein A4U43_C08F10750 [Asparagus officinalis]